jgi:quinolinate synthase
MEALKKAKLNLNTKGYLDLAIDSSLDLVREIKKLKEQKNAVLLAHYYQNGDIQDIADFLGDSLYLAQQAAQTEAEIIVFAGVHFMAETAKILNPDKKVLLPDLLAGCSLAASCPAGRFADFKSQHPEAVVVSYINTSAEIKALTDIVCTSSNAQKVIDSIPKDKQIIFAPDRNLGNYLQLQTGRDMLIWDGACTVHEAFSIEKIEKLMTEHPQAKLIAHPESRPVLLTRAEYIGSTSALLKFIEQDDNEQYIVATEVGILHEMKNRAPHKKFIAAPAGNSGCIGSECEYMKRNTLEKLYLCLKYELPEVIVDSAIAQKALLPIRRMLDL